MIFFDVLLDCLKESMWRKYLAEILIAVFAFSAGMRRRNCFWLRLVGGIVAYAIVCTLARVALIFIHPEADKYLRWSVAYIFASLLLLFCYAHRYEDALFCTSAGYALQNGCSTLSKLFFMSRSSALFRWGGFAFVLIAAGIVFFLSLRTEKKRDIRFGYVQIVSLSLLLLLVVSAMSFHLPGDTPGELTLSVIFQTAVDALILVILFSGVRLRRLTSERLLFQRSMAREGEYYNQMRDFVKVVDLHCHNLRQLVNTVRNHGVGADEHLLNELTETAALYGNMPATNNTAMNLVLADKVVYCIRHNIRFSYQIDGETLNRLSNSDVVILFNNILYNAIEYLSKLEEDKRILSLIVAKKNGFLYIHSENYFEGSVKMEEGVPVTTKEDKGSHGFGMKSIRFIVEKYGGTLVIGTDNNLFSINILIPEDKKGEAFAGGKKAPQN